MLILVVLGHMLILVVLGRSSHLFIAECWGLFVWVIIFNQALILVLDFDNLIEDLLAFPLVKVENLSGELDYPNC